MAEAHVLPWSECWDVEVWRGEDGDRIKVRCSLNPAIMYEIGERHAVVKLVGDEGAPVLNDVISEMTHITHAFDEDYTQLAGRVVARAR